MIEIKTPFDIIKYLGKKEYLEISNMDKKRNFFIINRMLSRALPEVAKNLGHMAIMPETAVDYWHYAFVELEKTSRGKSILVYFRKVLYISMSATKKKTKVNVDKDVAEKYMELSKISKKEFNILLEFFEKELIKYLKNVEKIINTTSK